MYGFTHLGNICQALERSSEEGDQVQARRLVQEIITYLDTVQIHYQKIDDTEG
jgi:hypothetical protein